MNVRTKIALILLFGLFPCLFGSYAWAVYGVRISDLHNTPLPPNPIRVWGKVTSVSPVKLFDGRAEITVTGITPALGDLLMITGDWSGGVLAAGPPPDVIAVPGTPSGCATPILGTSYTYSTTGSTCSQGHTVEYSFNWGDGTSSPWSASRTASHSWSTAGHLAVTVTARCRIYRGVYSMSAPLAVIVPSGLVTVTHADATTTAYQPTEDTDIARGAALLNAVAASVAGETITLSADTFTISRDVRLKDGQTLVGAGEYASKIKVMDKAHTLLKGDALTGATALDVEDTAGFREGQAISICPTSYDPADTSASGPPAGYQRYDIAIIQSVTAPHTITLTGALERIGSPAYPGISTQVFNCFNAIELGTPVKGVGRNSSSSANNVTIRDLEIDGNAANQTVCTTDEYQCGIHTAGSKHVTVESVYSHDTPFGCILFSHHEVCMSATPDADGTLTTPTAHGLRVDDVVVFTSTASGVFGHLPYYVVAVDSPTTFKVSASRGGTATTLTAGPPIPSFTDLGAHDVQIHNCNLRNQLYKGSIHFHGTQDVTIDGCSLNSSKDTHYGAIYGGGTTWCICKNVTIQACNITGAFEGITLSGQNIAIRNNTVHDTGGSGIKIYDAVAPIWTDEGHPSIGVVIDSNVIDNQQLADYDHDAAYGIYINKNISPTMFNNIVISNNTMRNCQYACIRDEGQNTVITGNTMHVRDYCGIYSFAPNSVIRDNVFGSTPTNRRAIDLRGPATNVQITGNTMNCLSNTAVDLHSGSSAYIENNYVNTADDNPFVTAEGSSFTWFGINTQDDSGIMYVWGTTPNAVTRQLQ